MKPLKSSARNDIPDLSRDRTSSGTELLRTSDFYEPFPQQRKFHESKAKYRLFGGAAGPGKTKALLWEAIYRALQVPGSDGLLLRRTYPELESSLLAYFRRDVPRDLYTKYNESKHVVTWRNGSTTRFGYCRNENDVYRYQGAEFLFIGLDELTHFTLKQWQFLTSRNRCPVPGSRCSMAGATNPGNIGHAWVKALWIDHKPPDGFAQSDLYNADDYKFIPARLADNPVYANDVEYRRTLAALPEHLRKAFLDGDWNVFAGQYFDIFDYGRHTARPEEIRLEAWWPRWISIDWGFQHPSAVYWHCAVPAEAHSRQLTADRRTAQAALSSNAVSCELPAVGSRIVTYRELVQNGLSPRMLAQGIAERSGRENIGEVFLSPDAFAHRTAEASIAEQLGDVLTANGLPRPAAADDDRVGGWQYMYQLMESDAWVITENCTKLIECMPTLVRDVGRVEDIRKMDGDDPADSARYGLVSGGRFAGVGTAFAPSRAGQPPPLKPLGSGAHFVTGMPLGEQISRQVSATDRTSQAIHYQRLEAEARKQFRPKKLPRRQR
ncbi:MAG TPA: phage terminase large subunit [Candidatus Acidoferrum sp.]|nr:phage terminase large subunit [Candidatus Acidoferrum sp.]